MPDETEETARKSCWIDSRLHAKAKIITVHTGETMSEVFERLLDGPLDREYRKHHGEQSAAAKSA